MKKLGLPLLILIVLVGMTFLLKRTGTDKSSPDADRGLKVTFGVNDIERVEISKAGGQVSLMRAADGKWEVKTPFGIKPADDKAIESALGELEKVGDGDLVSKNPEKHESFRVDDNNGTAVTFYGKGDKELKRLVIGRLGGFDQQQMMMMQQQGQQAQPDFHTFMRPVGENGSDNVYKVPGFFASLTGVDPDQWRAHDLADFTADEVVGLTLGGAARPAATVLEPDSLEVWYVLREGKDNEMTDPNVMRQLVNSLAGLRADGFQDSTVAPAATGLGEPQYTLEAKLLSGGTFNLSVGAKKNDNQYYAVVKGQPQIYLLSQYRVDQLWKSEAEILTGEKPEE